MPTEHHVQPVGNLSHYVDQATAQTHSLRSLVRQLKAVTDGVDPEQGYARSLMDLTWRMKNSAKVLHSELNSPVPKDPLSKTAVAKAGLKTDNVLVTLGLRRRKEYYDFF